MSIDLLIIDPPISMNKRYGHFAICGNKAPSYGLCYIAAVARRENFKVKILDMGVNEMDDNTFRDYLLKENPRVIGLTATTIAISDAAKVASFAKKVLPDIITVIGGYHLSSTPEATMLRYPEFDVGVIGEGEKTMLELLQMQPFQKENLSGINGLIWKDGEKVSYSEPRELIKDLNWLPLPAIDLLPDLATNYLPAYFSVKRTPAVLLMTTRGCPGRCTFCSNIVHGRVIRQYSLDHLFELIYTLTGKHGMREIQIMDDTFTSNKKRVKEFCERLLREKIDIVWSCLARVTGIDPETLAIMKKAGCWQICFGVESGDQDMLNAVKKDIKLEQVHKTINMTKRAGINVKGFFIMGFPGETRESLNKTLDLALTLPIDDLALTIFTPYPGTPVHKDIEKYGTFKENWDNMTTLNATFVAHGFTRDELLDINRATYRKFYFRPRIIFSYIKRISSFKFFSIMAKGLYGLLLPLFVKQKQFQPSGRQTDPGK